MRLPRWLAAVAFFVALVLTASPVKALDIGPLLDGAKVVAGAVYGTVKTIAHKSINTAEDAVRAIGYAAWAEQEASVPYTAHELGDGASGEALNAGYADEVAPADSFFAAAGLSSVSLSGTVLTSPTVRYAAHLTLSSGTVEVAWVCGVNTSVQKCGWLFFTGPDGLPKVEYGAEPVAGCAIPSGTTCYAGRGLSLQSQNTHGTTVFWNQTGSVYMNESTQTGVKHVGAAVAAHTPLSGAVRCTLAAGQAASLCDSDADRTSWFAMGAEGQEPKPATGGEMPCIRLAQGSATPGATYGGPVLLTAYPGWVGSNCTGGEVYAFIGDPNAPVDTTDPTQSFASTVTDVQVDCSQFSGGAWTGAVQTLTRVTPRTSENVGVPHCFSAVGPTWAPKTVRVKVATATSPAQVLDEYEITYPAPANTTDTITITAPQNEALTGVKADGSLRTANPTTNPSNDPSPNPATGEGGKPTFKQCVGSGVAALNPITWVYVPVKCVFIWAFVPETSIELDAVPIGDWVAMPSFSDTCPVFSFSMAANPVTVDICSGDIASIKNNVRPMIDLAVGFFAVLGGYRRVASMFGAGEDEA